MRSYQDITHYRMMSCSSMVRSLYRIPMYSLGAAVAHRYMLTPSIECPHCTEESGNGTGAIAPGVASPKKRQSRAPWRREG